MSLIDNIYVHVNKTKLTNFSRSDESRIVCVHMAFLGKISSITVCTEKCEYKAVFYYAPLHNNKSGHLHEQGAL